MYHHFEYVHDVVPNLIRGPVSVDFVHGHGLVLVHPIAHLLVVPEASGEGGWSVGVAAGERIARLGVQCQVQGRVQLSDRVSDRVRVRARIRRS